MVLIRNYVDNENLVVVVFLDLSRAFDTIGHSVLIAKLKCYRISGDEIKWFCDYLFHRSQITEWDGVESITHPVFTGVPQGSILGPLLFIIFFNDLQDSLTNAKIVMYADDTVVYYANKKVNDIEKTLTTEHWRFSRQK